MSTIFRPYTPSSQLSDRSAKDRLRHRQQIKNSIRYNIADIISEYSPLEFSTGALGMASAGKDTEGSQFFVMQGTFPHLTSRYTLFGRITDVQKVVDMIPQFSIIKKIILFE